MTHGWLPGEISINRIDQLQFMFVLYGLGFMLMALVLPRDQRSMAHELPPPDRRK